LRDEVTARMNLRLLRLPILIALLCLVVAIGHINSAD